MNSVEHLTQLEVIHRIESECDPGSEGTILGAGIL